MISTRRIDDTGEIDPPLDSFSELYDELANSDQEPGGGGGYFEWAVPAGAPPRSR